jgi:hypothetical protein
MKEMQLVLMLLGMVFSLTAQDLSDGNVSLDCKIDVTLGKGYTTSKVFVLNGEQFLFSHNANTGCGNKNL